jgi:thiol-disulfide isomerase/thioredoxin
MTTLVLVLSLAIVILMAYRFWEPFTVTPKREVRVGSANLYFFYTDWCGFSKKAMPVWEELEEKLRASPVFGTTKVTPVRVNAEKERALATLYEIEGYPTIKLETSSALIDYTGKRTVADLLAFLRETLG